ncbi:D-alanyl-D-alanine carboxypeptidase [Peribacillus cavernae]|uniref:serine-type D-Ala-D-Ala carboxypeptidase n=1 Tax=Peribacillus cavernae TaxID=1674310 RepID=A0A3S0TRU9_9BACI|nr:D-alanyl-D-alanine carboxypeptidase family protein [Peribacillus cavernae]MDQ0219039.1 D-alanyl-D-alanine carboxypeptidase [Peribacillus cavernae]RUQ26494.1 D-alanyl-D-alanine carboxypeptidase [Peribacillus cavernae]
MHFLYRNIPILIAIFLFISLNPAGTKAAMPVSAHNAILMEEGSGRVIYQENAHQKSKIASITKIMTALLAVESGKLDKTVTISGHAVGTEGSSLFLKNGEKMKLEDLTYGLMLRSGNDAAVAIAEYVGGSLDGFVWMMNRKAEEIGMKNTHFSNPHGLDNTKDHYSTAYDMALLTRYAMNNDTYRKISGTKVHRAPNTMENWDYVWRNKNRLLTQLYEYCTGGKTGFTKLAKRTLVTTASKNDLDLIAVTLNGPDDWNDHIYMYESAFKEYQNTEILAPGPLKEVKEKPYKGNIYIKNSFYYPLNEDEKDDIKIELKLLKPEKSWKKQADFPDKVGLAEVYKDGDEIGQRTIFYGKVKETFSLDQVSWRSAWKAAFNMVLGIKQNG